MSFNIKIYEPSKKVLDWFFKDDILPIFSDIFSEQGFILENDILEVLELLVSDWDNQDNVWLKLSWTDWQPAIDVLEKHFRDELEANEETWQSPYEMYGVSERDFYNY